MRRDLKYTTWSKTTYLPLIGIKSKCSICHKLAFRNVADMWVYYSQKYITRVWDSAHRISCFRCTNCYSVRPVEERSLSGYWGKATFIAFLEELE